MIDPQTVRLCLVTDSGMLANRPLADIVGAAIRGGVTMVQLREKQATTRTFVEQARALKTLLAGSGVPLLINDRIDVALAVEADGVHVGQDDMAVADARRLIGPDKILGLSITQTAELRGEEVALADYLGVGPVFTQNTKPDAAPPLGLEGLRRIRRLSQSLLMAIGGINANNAAAVRTAGADGMAVVSAIMAAADPEAAARALVYKGPALLQPDHHTRPSS